MFKTSVDLIENLYLKAVDLNLKEQYFYPPAVPHGRVGVGGYRTYIGQTFWLPTTSASIHLFLALLPRVQCNHRAEEFMIPSKISHSIHLLNLGAAIGFRWHALFFPYPSTPTRLSLWATTSSPLDERPKMSIVPKRFPLLRCML